jgi:hypothetical protein
MDGFATWIPEPIILLSWELNLADVDEDVDPS